MCGIAGIATIDRLKHLRDRVQRMTDVQIHRGPDDGGVIDFSCPEGPLQVALGNRRLAILDLSPAGHQPMSNEDASVWTVFNGEIYNFVELRDELISNGHLFRSHTDTEVILHGYEQWGLEALLSRLCGMFAFAIWDTKRSRLMIARDRMGEKPVYYSWDGKTLVFASELKALMDSGLVEGRVSSAAVVAYLALGSVPAPLTIFHWVRALPPGHMLVLGRSGYRLQEYWHLDFTENLRIGEGEALDEVRRLMLDAVKSRLVSDVPVGVFLSGGIDSSTIVALAREVTGGGALRTYSIVFPEREFSEASFAERIAREF